MDTLDTNVTGLTRYRGREGQISFILHRLTGLGTLLFLSIHILDTATVYFFPSLYEHAIDLYRSTPLMIGEIILVFSVIYHGVNGLRIAYFDLYRPDLWNIEMNRKSAVWTLAIAIVLWLPAAFLMGRSMLIHNFGL
ncbi:MAG TPA: succinate dehydrogenase, cytochrome b556 subunit [Anaerolineales bacterium]